jgi:60 kDa SS-A/Ro ribonucleoprotein
MLTALELSARDWTIIAGNAAWQTTRMNLNTFARHGVFRFGGMADMIAARLRHPELVKRSRALPYQLLVAYLNTSEDIPEKVREALQDAMEVALGNVPRIEGSVVVCPDVSGSMQWPVTGWQKGASSAVRCVDVAGLVAAALLRKNRAARVLPFEFDVVDARLNPRDSVMTNAEKLTKVGGGGTNCSAPLVQLNRERAAPDLVIFVSDNESWVDANRGGRSTVVMAEWEKLKQRNPRAKMVCIDIIPNATTQAPDRKDILNIGGFSDAVFEMIGSFMKDGNGADHWVREIENETLTQRIKTA